KRKPMIRRGSTRIVVVVGKFAFKFGRGERGKRSNRFEAELFQRVNPRRRAMLCPILWCSRTGTVLIARAATPLTDAERDELIRQDGFRDWDYVPPDEGHPFEWKSSDWGSLGGKLVALDYATPALFADEDTIEVAMREHPLWSGIDLKLEHARFFYQEMSRALQPNRGAAALQASGALVDARWQYSFYAYLDAFLVMTRSIPAIIEFCFGKDPQIKNTSFEALDQDEQMRRLNFSREFGLLHREFRQHPLSEQRNISFHRTGYPDVEVKITGRFGI